MKPVGDLVSIIIVVKNDRGIDATLEHVVKFGNDVPFETIVVDASTPDRLSDIKAKFPNVRWEQFPPSKHRTTPAQRNRGLELARGNIIAFLDANCIPAATWLNALVTAIKAGEDIVCGPVLDLSERNLVHYAPTHPVGKYVDVCTTISVGLNRKVFDRVGMFDTSFTFGQDIDFFWRATDAGFKIYYSPNFSIGHDWGKPKEQFSRAFQYGKARAHLYKKHWRNRKSELLHEPHVWVYPLYLFGLPVTRFVLVYPLLIFVPMIKNRSTNPIGVVSHHLTYGLGVIAVR